jgi:hypothetical protein
MRSLHLALASASVGVVLAGCSRPSSEVRQGALSELTQAKSTVLAETGTSQAHPAIDLLTDADIREITGKTLVRRTATSGSFMNAGEFELSGDNGIDASIVVGLMSSGGRSYFKKCLSQAANASVPNLGDGALSPETDHIIAVQGDTLVEVQYVGVSQAQPGVVNRIIERIFLRLK